MRKEQEIVTQEKQKFISDDHTENLNPYIAKVLEDSEGDFESKGSEVFQFSIFNKLLSVVNDC